MPGNGKNAVVWSSADKFDMVLETARINEAEFAEYCRGKGLFVDQVADWREACQQVNEAPAERNRELREQGKSDRKEIKQLTFLNLLRAQLLLLNGSRRERGLLAG